jgi:ParB family chromosome partitioning protein
MTTRSHPSAQIHGRPRTRSISQPLTGALEVPITRVVPDPDQPRKDWGSDEARRAMDELTDSIRAYGVLQPILVAEEEPADHGEPRYRVISGARRREAAQRAGLTTLPVVVRDADSAHIRILQLTENLLRHDLPPLDEARAYQELMDLKGLSPPALAATLHVSAQTVRDKLRVLADQVLADAVQNRQISHTAAKEIMKLPDDTIAEFRQRVAAGERLQTNDVVSARAAMQAAGVLNPRRRGPGRQAQRQTKFVPPPPHAVAQGEEYTSAREPVVLDVRAAEAAGPPDAAATPPPIQGEGAVRTGEITAQDRGDALAETIVIDLGGVRILETAAGLVHEAHVREVLTYARAEELARAYRDAMARLGGERARQG